MRVERIDAVAVWKYALPFDKLTTGRASTLGCDKARSSIIRIESKDNTKMQLKTILRATLLTLLAAGSLAFGQSRLDAERYATLRETERYQLDVSDRLFNQRKWDAARQEYEKFLRLHPRTEAAPFVQLRIGRCYENMRHVNQAIKEYRTLIRIFPDSPEAPAAYMALGRSLYATGETDEAIAEYRNVIAKHPETAAAAEALWLLSELVDEEAADFRLQIVENHPDSNRRLEAARWLAGHFLFAQNNKAEARRIYRLVRPEDETESYLARRAYDSARWLFRQGDERRDEAIERMDLAIELYEGLVENYPDSRYAPDAGRMVAWCYRESGRRDEAVKAFREYLARNPEDDGHRRNFGRTLEQDGEWDEARAQFALFHDAAEGALEIAESFHRQRNVETAEEQYLKVVEDYPAQASRALYRLGELHMHVSRDYERAINVFRQSEYRPPAHLFRIGECYERWDKYTEAIETYRQIRNFFQDHAPQAMRREVGCFEKRGEEGDLNEAVRLLKMICDNFPRSNQSSWANQHLNAQYDIHYTGGGVK